MVKYVSIGTHTFQPEQVTSITATLRTGLQIGLGTDDDGEPDSYFHEFESTEARDKAANALRSELEQVGDVLRLG